MGDHGATDPSAHYQHFGAQRSGLPSARDRRDGVGGPYSITVSKIALTRKRLRVRPMVYQRGRWWLASVVTDETKRRIALPFLRMQVSHASAERGRHTCDKGTDQHGERRKNSSLGARLTARIR
jgi:hypothetical protein